MQTTTLLYIILALLLSISVAFFQYFYKNKENPKINILLFVLRALSLFLLSLLFVNPKISIQEIENSKPKLSVLIDNSESTKYFNQQDKVRAWLQRLKLNKSLNNKFNITYFSFGKNLTILDSLNFNDKQTNIFKAIKSVNELYKSNLGTTILISDGNQTIGNDYEFINSKQSVYPVVLGDTTSYKDVKITQLNVNKYSYIKNKFPVEVLLNYEGNQPINTRFSIYLKGKEVFTQQVSFSSNNNSKTILTNLTSTKEGLNYYTASIQKLDNEKNTINNLKTFSVEVIDEQTKVLILASVLHPDIGAIKKAIESNKQRKVDVFLIDKFKNQLEDYQLVIVIQPNKYFNYFFKRQKSNYLLITGSNTDWNFLNTQQLGFSKKAINLFENYTPIFNSQFLTFHQKDIGFNNYPPLKDVFGEITLKSENQLLLKQKLGGIETNQPLLATFEKGENKSAVLFGEGIWKWRANSYRETNSFEDFDRFIGNLVQYLSSNKKRSRLEVNVESLYPANSNVTISAFYTDKNYKFDSRASLQILLTNEETKKKTTIPFSLTTNSYQVSIEDLPKGNYTYQVSVLGQNVKKYGKFKITDFKIEEQFIKANHIKLEKLANKTGGKLFYSDQEQILIEDLIKNESLFTVQKSITKEQDLIDWKWIMFIVIGLLSVEWFIRKYYGKI